MAEASIGHARVKVSIRGSTLMRRKTRQREAVCRVFTESEIPLGPHEALHAAQHHVPGMGIATVYRTIRILLAEGWLIPIELPGRTPLYQRSQAPHQHYFQCRQCVTMVPVACPARAIKRLAPSGFQLEHHEMVLYGLCANCQGRNP